MGIYLEASDRRTTTRAGLGARGVVCGLARLGVTLRNSLFGQTLDLLKRRCGGPARFRPSGFHASAADSVRRQNEGTTAGTAPVAQGFGFGVQMPSGGTVLRSPVS